MKEMMKINIIAVLTGGFWSVVVLFLQLNGQDSIENTCSYLDPPIIDFLAFSAALFLIIEGFFRINQHKESSIMANASRIVRITFGCTILTIHVIQFLHK